MENTKMSCDKCNYFTHSKSDYKKHLLSTKHINQETLEILEYKYMRECKKKYSGNWGYGNPPLQQK